MVGGYLCRKDKGRGKGGTDPFSLREVTSRPACEQKHDPFIIFKDLLIKNESCTTQDTNYEQEEESVDASGKSHLNLGVLGETKKRSDDGEREILSVVSKASETLWKMSKSSSSDENGVSLELTLA